MRLITLPFLALVLLTFSSCAPKPEASTPKEAATEPAPAAAPAPEPVASTPKEAATEPAPAAARAPEPVAAAPSNVLSTHYIDAAAALAADDLPKSKAALAALASESTGELKTLAQTAADTGDIAATRDAFKALSKVATTMELPPDYAVAFCPMYKNGSKWVQKKDATIANPYFGKQMLTCGSFVN